MKRIINFVNLLLALLSIKILCSLLYIIIMDSLEADVRARRNSRSRANAARYFSRLFKFTQLDFETARWQMMYLILDPKRVYRNVVHKQSIGLIKYYKL